MICKNKVLIDAPSNIDIAKKDYLTYTPYETFYSSDKAKEKAQKNGFIAENEGSASKFYNLILFDVEKEELKRLKTNFDVYYWPSTKTVSLQSKGCSRVRAIKELIDYLGFELDQVIYFGDGPNDLEVFKFVSCCIAMGDCYPGLLEYSTYQIDSCQNDDVAKFILENYK